MSAHGWFGAVRAQAPSVERSVLELVHPAPYVAFIEELCEAGGGAIDADTYAVARHVRGGAALVRRGRGHGRRAAGRRGGRRA